MLNKFSDDYDKTEGTVLWDICQAFALEFYENYEKVEQSKKGYFLKTITDEEIFDWKLADYGEERKKATYADGIITVKGKTNAIIDKGIMVASDTAEYEILNTMIIPTEGFVNVPIKCMIPGKVGNTGKGTINKFPITITGLYECFNNEGIVNGVDRESIDEARKRVEEKLKEPKTSGNRFDYKFWAKEVSGVGNARVIERDRGVNSVKILITDRNNDLATETLIKDTFDYIEQIRPVGANVLVESAKLKLVEISINGLKTDMNANQTTGQIKLNIKENLKTYINSISLDNTMVSYAQCSKLILDSEGVGDFFDLKLNGTVGTVELAQDEIARFSKLLIDGDEI